VFRELEEEITGVLPAWYVDSAQHVFCTDVVKVNEGDTVTGVITAGFSPTLLFTIPVNFKALLLDRRVGSRCRSEACKASMILLGFSSFFLARALTNASSAGCSNG
jgi:hypothetical protein